MGTKVNSILRLKRLITGYALADIIDVLTQMKVDISGTSKLIYFGGDRGHRRKFDNRRFARAEEIIKTGNMTKYKF